jgi:gliding motility-associated-like protein
MYFRRIIFLATVAFAGISFSSNSQIVVSTALPPAQLVQSVLVGSGVSVSNITYSGVAGSIGKFTGGAGSNLGLNSGIVISTGLVNGTTAIGSAASNQASTDNGTGSDPQLQSLVSATVQDASVLQFDFRPISDTIRFRYVFGSEEYPEFVGMGYNDVFGFFVTGPNPSGGNYTNYNIARIPGTTVPVTIDNVNSGSYSQYYVNNGSGMTVVFDGFTTVLTAWCRVTPCQNYHIKIAIGDAGDGVYDSGVFLEENSFSSTGISYHTSFSSDIDTLAVEGCNNALVAFTLGAPATSDIVIHYSVGGTAVEGVDYPAIPDSLVIPAGQDSVSLQIVPISDSIGEPVETVIISYVNTICGTTDSIIILIKDYTPIATNITPTVSSCNGTPANVQISGTGGYPPLSYAWNTGESTNSIVVNPASPTTYYVTVADQCNFYSTDSVRVSISNLSSLFTAVDSVSCNNASDGGLTVTEYNGLPPFHYVWSNSDTTATVSNLSSGNYTVTVTDGIGCTSTNTITLTNPPALMIALDPTNETCSNSCNGQIICNITGNPSPPYTYQWSSNPAQTDSAAVNLCAGDYTLTVTYSPNNCHVTATTNVGTNTVIDAQFTPNPVQGYVPFDVNFYFTGTGAVNYSWDFADGSPLSTDMNPVHTYTSMGVYNVVVTVNSGAPDFCVDSFKYEIIAIQPSSMVYPNVFTPNGDGSNDNFSVMTEGINSFKANIYNRWGKKVFETSVDAGFSESMTKTDVWDGRSNSGAECAAGVYYFIIEAMGYDGKEYSLNGSVQLMR